MCGRVGVSMSVYGELGELISIFHYEKVRTR